MEKKSFMYGLYRIFVRFYHNWFWHKSIVVRGEENIPVGKPIIFAPNHQNALMDALAFVFNYAGQIVFLARADIFKGKFAIACLEFMRILPIYRMRDGAKSLGKNEAIFDKSIRVLENKNQLALFPEAQHWGFRKLRSIKKGVPRIAFLAEERNDFNLDLMVVPVGLYYDEYQKFRKKLLINYGKPIPVAQFKEEYETNENIGFMALRRAMASGMKDVMMHIATETYYDDVDTLRQIVNYEACKKIKGSSSNISQSFDADRITIAVLDAMIVEDESAFLILKKKADEFTAELASLKLGFWVVQCKGYGIFALLGLTVLGALSLPLFVFGFLSHIFPKTILDSIVKKKVKDPQFVRSFTFALGLFLLPINYFFCLLAVSIFVDLQWYYWLAIALALPVAGAFAHDYSVVANRFLQTLRYRMISKQGRLKFCNIYNFLVREIVR